MGQCASGGGGARERRGTLSKGSLYVANVGLPEQEEFARRAALFAADGQEASDLQPEEQGVALEVLRFLAEEQQARGWDATTGEVCERAVVEMTREKRCALVEMLAPAARGRPTHFISHPWKNPFRVTIDAVLEACEEWERATGRQAMVWMDVFAINQHKMTAQQYTQVEIDAMLKRAVESCEHMYACLYPWNDPVYVKRAWCLYEVFTAMATMDGAAAGGGANGAGKRTVKAARRATRGSVRRRQGLRFILSSDARAQFEREALSDDSKFEAIVRAMSDLDVRKAEAFKQEDKDMILSSIESSYGGTQGLNVTVSEQLRGWLLETAREIVERRRRTHAGTAELACMLVNFGRLLGDQAASFASSDHGEALELFREALSIDRGILALHEQDPGADCAAERRNVARDRFLIGSSYYSQRDFARALEEYEAAREMYKRDGSSADQGRVLTQLGPTLMKLGRWDEAVDSLREAVDSLLLGDSPERAEALSLLAYVLFKLPESGPAELNEANRLREDALLINAACLGEEHPTVAMSLFQLARGATAAGDHARAAAHFERATRIYAKIFGEGHEKTRKMEQRYISAAAAAATSGLSSPSAPAAGLRGRRTSSCTSASSSSSGRSGSDAAEMGRRPLGFLPPQASSRRLEG